MRYAALPHDFPVQQLPFYLAMEEYVARSFSEEFFFMWQVEPTVIFGRNQCIDNEVDIEYCRANGIKMVRRKSGGGCVFADMKNIMFSYITSATDVETTFSSYTSRVAEMLRSLGLNATATGRNDVLIDDQKVSGNAFYHIPGRSIVHGTMLFDTDFKHITHAISPSREKLESKGVQSVRSRVTTLNQHISLSIDQFKAYARKAMCDGPELMLTADDIAEIRKIEASYYNPEWIYGKRSATNKSLHARIDGVGDFIVDLEIIDNKIRNINLSGDFFLLGDLDGQLLSSLIDLDYNKEAVSAAVKDISINKIISKLTNEQFINLLF